MVGCLDGKEEGEEDAKEISRQGNGANCAEKTKPVLVCSASEGSVKQAISHC